MRLYYDYLVEEGVRTSNPAGRGRYTPGRVVAGASERGLVPRYRKLPWIPTDAQWRAMLEAARAEPPRNRLMLALAYDAGLRREELCSLETGDVDPATRLLRIRAETTKGRRERVVPYSEPTGLLYAAYLRAAAQAEPGARTAVPLGVPPQSGPADLALDLVQGRRAARRPRRRATVLDPHPAPSLPDGPGPRGLGRARDRPVRRPSQPQTTLLYIHLSGRELAAKLERGMAQIHAWRADLAAEVLG